MLKKNIFYILYFIICDYEINSFDTISTLEGMKWKEWSSKKLLKQWYKGKILNLCEKMWVKQWSTPIKGEGKKCKIDII
jgi:hypothetical protein